MKRYTSVSADRRIANQDVGGAIAEFLKLEKELAAKIIASLGKSTPQDETLLPNITYDVLLSYGEGLDAQDRGNWDEAIRLFKLCYSNSQWNLFLDALLNAPTSTDAFMKPSQMAAELRAAYRIDLAEADDPTAAERRKNKYALATESMSSPQQKKNGYSENEETSIEFIVSAHDPQWQNTGLEVKRNQKIHIQVLPNQKWNLGWGWVDAGGHDRKIDPYAGTARFPTARWAALIGKIGVEEFEIGKEKIFSATQSGILFLMMNDNPHHWLGYSDNSGKIVVNIKIK